MIFLKLIYVLVWIFLNLFLLIRYHVLNNVKKNKKEKMKRQGPKMQTLIILGKKQEGKITFKILIQIRSIQIPKLDKNK
jgi:hypothetical protein